MQRTLKSACFLLLLIVKTPGLDAQTKPRFITDDDSLMAANDVAKTLGLQRLFEQLTNDRSRPKDPMRTLLIRQKLLEEVTSASLQVDATAGQIDAEIAEIKELQNYLEGKRQREIDLLNLASLVAGGSLGTASASLGLAGEGKASSITGILAGGVTASLSVVGLKRRGGSTQALQVPSNMLANLFDQPVVANNIYPPVVQSFMQSSAPNEKEGFNRKDRLIHNWIQVGRIPDIKSPKGQDKLQRLTTMPSQLRRLSIHDLNDRQAMLYDFRARLLFLKRDLARFLASVPNDLSLEP